MSFSLKSNTVSTGLAMFSMFFGAGNVVFPLALGQIAQDSNFFAILGLLISAVCVPFLGLISMTLFDGNYKNFFERIGKIPGFIVMVCILGLIGPFGAIPRCIALSYSTLELYFPGMSLPIFSIVSCLIIYAFTAKKNSILDVLGYVLTPLLLASLVFIIIKGLITAPEASPSNYAPLEIFLKGLKDGYQTMDLLGAFFFSSVVLNCLKDEQATPDQKNFKNLIFMALKASFIGAFLLSAIYIGFSYVAAFHSESIAAVNQDQLIGVIAIKVLGPLAGVATCIAVALACLTTAIALAAVFAEFLHKDVSFGKISYVASLVITLVISYFISTLNFMGIANMIQPILQVCYPALIVLSIVNILYKLCHFKSVKVPVFATFGLSLLAAVYEFLL